MGLDAKRQASLDKIFGKPVTASTDTMVNPSLLNLQNPALKPIINELNFLLGPNGLDQEQKKGLLGILEGRATEARKSRIVNEDYSFNPGFLGLKRGYHEGCLIKTLGELRDTYMEIYNKRTQTPPGT
ncbi:MAG: hypothetical protein AABX33_01040 [Nanoarchaeota archaeon]